MTALNLASARLGATAHACSDDSFASMDRLIQDHPPVWKEDVYDDFGKWMDGWESKRRRSGGHDWCIIKLAVPGRIQSFQIDTAYFTGNFPPGAQVLGASGDQPPAPDSNEWVELTPLLDLQGNHAHKVACSERDGVFQWVMLNIYPDGGVARLKVFGEASLREPVVNESNCQH